MSDQLSQFDESEVKIFVGDQAGPEGYSGFFEDDGETGYLYVSDRKKCAITQHLQIYINSGQLDVEAKDIKVVWSNDGNKCGVSIWGGMRGIIDVVMKREGRVFVESRDTPPINDPEWLDGFGFE